MKQCETPKMTEPIIETVWITDEGIKPIEDDGFPTGKIIGIGSRSRIGPVSTQRVEAVETKAAEPQPTTQA